MPLRGCDSDEDGEFLRREPSAVRAGENLGKLLMGHVQFGCNELDLFPAGVGDMVDDFLDRVEFRRVEGEGKLCFGRHCYSLHQKVTSRNSQYSVKKRGDERHRLIGCWLARGLEGKGRPRTLSRRTIR